MIFKEQKIINMEAEEAMEKDNVIIAGTYPPPIGGVTIHIMRLKELLDSSRYKSFFVDLRPKKNTKVSIDKKQYIKSLIYCLRKAKDGVLHYQLNNWIEGSLLSIGSKIYRIKMVYTVHSFRIEEFSLIKRMCFRITSKYVSEFIAPSLTTKEKLILYKVNIAKVKVLNTYLPPIYSELNEPIPEKLEEFVNMSNYVVLANASRLYRDTDNTDVYGLDMCIELCASLPNISLVFCAPIIADKPYLDECLQKINSLGIENRFLIFNKDVSFASLFRYADLFVRPTSTDSFGISVAEALSCRVPAVASDVCERANGTILFESRNSNEFLEKVKFCMERKSEDFIFELENNHIKSYTDLYDGFLQ